MTGGRGSMDLVQGGGPWTPGPCFVLTPICWIEIYPVDSAIHLLNNWGQMRVSKLYRNFEI